MKVDARIRRWIPGSAASASSKSSRIANASGSLSGETHEPSSSFSALCCLKSRGSMTTFPSVPCRGHGVTDAPKNAHPRIFLTRRLSALTKSL
ncbi:unnamed protein product [Victoria cruziana]